MKSPASLRGPGLVFGVLCAGPVLAAQNPDRADQLLTVFIAQLVVLLTVSRIFGEVMQRLGQPPVMGQLLAGVALGPSGLGLIWPAAEAMLFPTTAGQREMINAVGQLGIMMMLLITGMETDLSVVKRVRRPALSASAAGIIVPFTCGVGLGWLLPDSLLPAPGRRLVTALFLGTALSIASVKVVAMVVRQMNFMRRNVGQVVLASAIVDDTVGWLIIAVTFGIALHGTVEITSLAAIAAGTALFLALSFTLGRRVVSVLIRWSNDFLHSGYAVVSMILVIGGAMSLITQFIGVHTVLGAIVAGMLIGQSPILTRHIDEQLRGLVEGLFMPVFFALSGLSADLTILRDGRLAGLAVLFIAIASIGKFAGALGGGRLGGMTWRESLALGCGMNARGSTEVIVASIGLSIGALNRDLYTIIVAMAIATTMAMPPSLRWALRRIPLSQEERERIEQEEFEARGFVSNLERLLVTVDRSGNGRFASRLAGLLAGSRQILTTVVDVAPEGGQPRPHQEAKEVVQAVAENAAADSPRQRGAGAPALQGAAMTVGALRHGAVERESRKGHDFLVVGFERSVDEHGVFQPDAAHAIAQFSGPFAVVIGRGVHLEDPLHSALRMLVPVTGNDYSQRGAEVAFAMAQAARAAVTLLYVSTATARPGWKGSLRQGALTAPEQAILRSMVGIAERYGVEARTEVALRRAPSAAILQRIRGSDYDLVVLGVNRRAGETPFFGTTATEVLTGAKTSVVLVST